MPMILGLNNSDFFLIAKFAGTIMAEGGYAQKIYDYPRFFAVVYLPKIIIYYIYFSLLFILLNSIP